MPVIRHIVAILLLLSQAWPVQAAWGAMTHEACASGCCAVVTVEVQSGCACEAEPVKPAPMQVPLPEGREMIPQVPCVEDGRGEFLPAPADAEAASAVKGRGMALHPQPVRLQVLLCSFLN